MGLYFNIALFLPFEKINENKIEFIAKVLECDSENEYYKRYIVKIIYIKENIKIKNVKVYIHTEATQVLEIGQVIKGCGIYTRGEKNRNYKGFNYREYLIQKKIFGIIEIEKINIINKDLNLETIIFKLKEEINLNINELFPNRAYASFLNSILLGKNLDNDEIKENFKKTNLSHILAISGMHITYIIAGINKLNIKNKRILNYTKLIFLYVYLWITGSSPSCLRACIMAAFFIITKLIHRKNNIYITTFNAFLLCILYNIFNIKNAGMWLSFCGMLGIILFHKFIYKFFILKLKIKSRVLKKIIEISCISISAQILIFPIMIYFFNTISLNFIISNLATNYLIGPIILIGYILVIFSLFKIEIFIKVLKIMEEILLNLLLKITEGISQKFDYNLYTITPNIISIILYYLSIIFIILIFKNNKFKFIRYCFNLKNIKNVLKGKLTKIIVYIIIFNIIINLDININKNLIINFVDVGQGDCTLIKTPNNKKILIDGGEGNSDKYDYGKNVLYPYLLDKKIKKIDFVFISHFDSDHVGGLIYILEHMNVKNVVIGKQFENSNQYEDLKEIVKRKNIKVIIVENGDVLCVEENIEIEILWPEKENNIPENVLNNNSLVFKLMYINMSILFTGDIEKVAEDAIIKLYKNNQDILNSSILKLAHHGSKTSTIEEFLNLVNPKIAIANVGKNNNFGHPSEIVLERLKKRNILLYRTDLNGEINIEVNSKGKMKIKTRF